MHGSSDGPRRRGVHERIRLSAGHHQPQACREPLNPRLAAIHRDVVAELLVGALKLGRLVDPAAHVGAVLEHLDLREHDRGQHHAEQRDPPAAAYETVEPSMVGD